MFLTGDIHMAWANEVPVKAATYPLSPSAATEFVVTSVTSDNLDDILQVAPQTVSLVASAAVRAANRHVKWVDMDSHGYGVLDVTAERSQMDYYVLSDKTAQDATSAWARSYRTRRGTQKVERVDRPVRVRQRLQRGEEAERDLPGLLGGRLRRSRGRSGSVNRWPAPG